MNLSQRTARGIAWKGSSNAAVGALNFLITAMLARFLHPSDFGLIGMITVTIGFVSLFADLGLGAAIIQKQELRMEQLSTLFFLNICAGLVLCAATFWGAGFIALFFGHGELTQFLRIISLAFVISSLGQTFNPLLQKELKFKSLFKIEIIGTVSYGIISIGLAIKGLGVWSFVYGSLIRALLQTILLWRASSFKPHFIIATKETRSVIHFSLYVFGDRLLNYFNRNLDNIMIGKFLGANALGYYSLAYSLMLMPISKIAHSVTAVLFPVFSLIQDDDTKMREGFLKILKYISLVTFPLMALLFAEAREFILAVYGRNWLPTIAVLQVLCFVGALQSVSTTAGPVQYAKGRSDLSFKFNCLAICVWGIGFYLGLRWGILGVAAVYALLSLALEPLFMEITLRLIHLKWRVVLEQFAVPTLGATLIIIIAFGAKTFLRRWGGFSEMMIFISTALVSILAYALIVLMKERKSLLEGAEVLGLRRRT